MTLAEMVKTKRQITGWTLAEASKRSGISGSYLWQIENGKSVPTAPQTLKALALTFAIPEKDLARASKTDCANAKLKKYGLEKLPPIHIKTLRDEFAMAALQGLLAKYGSGEAPRSLAVWAFNYADAMMTEREQK